jgi:protein CpxP
MTNDITVGGKRRSLNKLMLALLAGSLVTGAGGYAFAKAGYADADPAKFQQRIEKRVDRALKDTDATAEQKKKVTEIIQAGFTDLKPVHAKSKESFKAMKEAMQAPTIDKAKVEAIRAEQMKLADDSSKRITKAMTDAGDVLNQAQRQAFFKNWDARHGHKRG